jgi:hypothetical protein
MSPPGGLVSSLPLRARHAAANGAEDPARPTAGRLRLLRSLGGQRTPALALPATPHALRFAALTPAASSAGWALRFRFML